MNTVFKALIGNLLGFVEKVLLESEPPIIKQVKDEARLLIRKLEGLLEPKPKEQKGDENGQLD
jgi:hypothetical protein